MLCDSFLFLSFFLFLSVLHSFKNKLAEILIALHEYLSTDILVYMQEKVDWEVAEEVQNVLDLQRILTQPLNEKQKRTEGKTCVIDQQITFSFHFISSFFRLVCFTRNTKYISK